MPETTNFNHVVVDTLKMTTAKAQADSEATTAEGLVTDFNALLAKLRDAGVIAKT